MEINKNILICRVEGDAGDVRESHSYFFRSYTRIGSRNSYLTCFVKKKLIQVTAFEISLHIGKKITQKYQQIMTIVMNHAHERCTNAV